jgi:Uma2 family endonuclease
MTLSTVKMNADQFLMLGEDPPGLRLELVNGEIVLSPSPSYEHSFTDTQLRTLLNNYIQAEDLGELVGDVDTVFGELDVLRPDIIFIAKSRIRREERHGIHIAPDLCVEIISPDSGKRDRRDKFKFYAKHKVKHYWIVDPAQKTFDAFRLAGTKFVATASGRDGETVKAPPFPELEIPLGRLWLPARRRRNSRAGNGQP